MSDVAYPVSPTRVCTRCVMDDTDPTVTFDEDGRCSACRSRESKATIDLRNQRAELEAWVSHVRRRGEGQEFDCIIGLSGGTDSSYAALKAHDLGVRPLVVHIDTGWNSAGAVHNIQALVDHCGYDLHTVVINWDTMRRLQLAYLRSGVSNQDVPQDHAIFAGLYNYAQKHDIRTVINGHNKATEAIVGQWHGPAMDAKNLRSIFDTYGEGSLDGYPLISFSRYYITYPILRRMQSYSILDRLEYDKQAAEQELSERVGWKPYGRKHGESLWTRFFQNYYLPTRWGYDKRKPHLSSRILAGEITRDEALASLAEPLYDQDELRNDRAYTLKKLRISDSDWEDLMVVPHRSHEEFRTWRRERKVLQQLGSVGSRLAGPALRLNR